jgi:leucyl-tRNA synthetase
MGHVSFEVPFTRFRAHGLLTLNGAKMSKSRGNVVNPDEYIAHYGADTLRMYLMFLGPFDQGGTFSDTGIGGVHRFLHRVWRLVVAAERTAAPGLDERRELHRLIERVTNDLTDLRYNTAIAALMAYVNGRSELFEEAADVLPRLLAPFAPHLAEELWARLGRDFSVHQQRFPTADPALVRTELQRLAVQVNGRTRGMIELPHGATEAEALAAARALPAVGQLMDAAPRVVYRAGRVLNVVTETSPSGMTNA